MEGSKSHSCAERSLTSTSPPFPDGVQTYVLGVLWFRAAEALEGHPVQRFALIAPRRHPRGFRDRERGRRFGQVCESLLWPVWCLGIL